MSNLKDFRSRDLRVPRGGYRSGYGRITTIKAYDVGYTKGYEETDEERQQ